nr:PsiF family protein [Caballeronia calidae]
MTQQEKMTACNSQAGDKKGDDRKAFMKSCLSSKG